jgi:hypothetical protein
VLRRDYFVVQELVWNADFRRAFLRDPQAAVRARFPDVDRLERFTPAQFPGVEEAAYYRIASVCRSMKEVFPRGHHLMSAFGGLAFVECLLANYLDAPAPTDAVYELFDGYILGPEVLRCASAYSWPGDNGWIVNVLEYEWAAWHSRRVARGWRSLVPRCGRFAEGVFLLHARFDLPALLADVDRMIAASAPEEVLRWRVRPLTTVNWRAAVFPSGDQIAEVELGEETFDQLAELAQDPELETTPEFTQAFTQIGLLVAYAATASA